LGDDHTQDEDILQDIYWIEDTVEALDVGLHEQGIDIGDGQACLVSGDKDDVQVANVHGTAPNRPRQLARAGCGTAPAPRAAAAAHHEPSAVRNEFMVLLLGLAAAVYNTENNNDELGQLHLRVVAIGLGFSTLGRADQVLFRAVEKATSCGLARAH